MVGFLFNRSTDLNLAIERHPKKEMFKWASVTYEDFRCIRCSIMVEKTRVVVEQAYDPAGEIDWDVVLTKALILYDV